MSSEHVPAPEGGSQESTAPNFADIYKEVHPDAVEDSEKARVMAHASDAAETEGVRMRQAATGALLGTKGDVTRPDGESYENQREAAADAVLLTADAEDARKEADVQAEWAGNQYDKIQATKTSSRTDGPAKTAPEENR